MANELHPCECSLWTNPTAAEHLNCTSETKGKFAPGHDAKLKGLLTRANVEGQPVRRGQIEMTVEYALKEFFPQWTTRVSKSTRSALADRGRKTLRAESIKRRREARKPAFAPETPAQCETPGCGLKALPGNTTCRVCSLMASMEALMAGAPRTVATDPGAIDKDAPPSRPDVSEIEWVGVDAASVASEVVSQDEVAWHILCEGGCHRTLTTPKVEYRPAERRGDQTTSIERRYSAPTAQTCGVCNPTWPVE